MNVAHERHEIQFGRSAPSDLPIESLISFLVFSIIHCVSHLVSDEATGHLEMLMGVVVPASDSLELDSWSIVELFWAAERGDRVSTANHETSEWPPFMDLVPGNGWSAGQS